MRLVWPILLGAIFLLVGCSAAGRIPPTATAATAAAVRPGPTGTSAAQTTAGPAPTFVSIAGAPPGQTAHVTIQTQAGSTCSVAYFGPDGTLVVADGLDQQVADGSGRVTWSWTIEPKSATGKGNFRVRCNGVDATAEIPIS